MPGLIEQFLDRLKSGFHELRNPRMEMLRGIATHVTRAAHVSGNQQGVSTSQVVNCEINNRPVEIWMPAVPMIENGDELIVAGKLKFGKLEAWAFRNLRNGTSGHWDYNINQFATLAVIFMIVLAVACIIPVFLILPLLFIPYAVIAVLNRLRIAKEYRAIMTEPAEENSERAN